MGGLRLRQFAKAVFKERRALYCLALLLAVVVAVGCGGSDDGSGQSEPTIEASVSPTAAPATPTARPATPSPTSTSEPTVPPATALPPAPTADTRVPIRDLPTANQIQLGKDGKYFVADRGDGCTWVEHGRTISPDFGEEIVLVTDCPIDFAFVYRIGTGEIFPLS